MWDGANFKLKIRKVEGYRNYDKSEFEDPAPLADSDEDMAAIWQGTHSLEAFLAPSQFKSYDELKKKLEKVLAEPSGQAYRDEEDIPFERPTPRPAAAPAVGKSASAPKAKAAAMDDDDDLSFFEKLAEDDD
jgi:hypothetical protein